MEFKSIEEIKNHFQFMTIDPSEMKNELRKLIKTIHPDANGGEFRTKADEKYFQEIQDAMQYFESSQTALVTRQELSELAKFVKDLIPSINSNPNESTVILERKIDFSIAHYKRKHLFPKLSTTAIAAVITAIWLFPKIIPEHPILKHYLSNENIIFNIIWFATILICGTTWLVFKVVESKDEDLKRRISLETSINQLFNKFIYWRSHLDTKDNYFYFNKDQLIKFIMDYDLENDTLHSVRIRFIKSKFKNLLYKLGSILPSYGNVDMDLAQRISDVIIQKGIKREIIEIVDKKSIAENYRTPLINNDND